MRPTIGDLSPSVSVSLLVAPGLSNAEVAETLHVSVPTAKQHVSRILTKLAARDRAQLVVIAYESRLVELGQYKDHSVWTLDARSISRITRGSLLDDTYSILAPDDI